MKKYYTARKDAKDNLDILDKRGFITEEEAQTSASTSAVTYRESIFILEAIAEVVAQTTTTIKSI